MTRADKRNYHYIYKITRIDTGRFYIGMHSTDDLDDGYFGSGKIITASIKKHGKDKHTKEILEQLPSREALKLREREIVNEQLLGNKLCMNLKLGGEGGGRFWSDEHRAKFFDAAKLTGKVNGPATLNKLRQIDPTFQFRISSAGGTVSGPKVGPLTVKSMQTDEVNEKRKKTFAERKHQQGESNSQFGTKWVHKDGKCVKIKSSQLDKYLEDGFLIGRK